MPRINDTDYRNRRATLRADWEKGGKSLGRLTNEQRSSLRTLYLFDLPLRSSDFASARSEATRRDPNLVRQAGLAYRAFAKLNAQRRAESERCQNPGALAPARAATRRPQTSNRRIAVFSETNTHIEPDEIARIIIAIAREHLQTARPPSDSDSV